MRAWVGQGWALTGGWAAARARTLARAAAPLRTAPGTFSSTPAVRQRSAVDWSAACQSQLLPLPCPMGAQKQRSGGWVLQAHPLVELSLSLSLFTGQTQGKVGSATHTQSEAGIYFRLGSGRSREQGTYKHKHTHAHSWIHTYVLTHTHKHTQSCSPINTCDTHTHTRKHPNTHSMQEVKESPIALWANIAPPPFPSQSLCHAPTAGRAENTHNATGVFSWKEEAREQHTATPCQSPGGTHSIPKPEPHQTLKRPR